MLELELPATHVQVFTNCWSYHEIWNSRKKLQTSWSIKMFQPQIKSKQLFFRSSRSPNIVFKFRIDLHGNDQLMLLLTIIIMILTVSNFGAGMYVLLTRAWNSDVTNGFVSRNIINMLDIISSFVWKHCSSTQLTTLSNVLLAFPRASTEGSTRRMGHDRYVVSLHER